MSRRKKFKGKPPWVGKTLAHRLKGVEDMYDTSLRPTWPRSANWNKRPNPGVGFYKDQQDNEALGTPFFPKELLARAMLPDPDDETAERVEELFTYPCVEVCEDGVYFKDRIEVNGLSGFTRTKVVTGEERKAHGLQVGEQLDEFKIMEEVHGERKVSFRRRSTGR